MPAENLLLSDFLRNDPRGRVIPIDRIELDDHREEGETDSVELVLQQPHSCAEGQPASTDDVVGRVEICAAVPKQDRRGDRAARHWKIQSQRRVSMFSDAE